MKTSLWLKISQYHVRSDSVLTSVSMLSAFKLLGYFSGLCGFRMVATRFPSDATILLTKISGRCSALIDAFRLLFNGAKKYFGVGLSISFVSSCTIFPSSVIVGGGGRGKEVLRLRKE